MGPESGNQSKPTVDPQRLSLVDRARAQWIKRLIDLSRRNRLLFFRDLKTGTIDLTSCGKPYLQSFLRYEPVKASDLLPEQELQSAMARMLEIRRRAFENLEEKGLETMYLCLGLAGWESVDGGRPPASPVLLVPASMDVRGREGRATALRRTGDIEVNPVLMHALGAQYGIQIEAEEIVGPIENEGSEPSEVLPEIFAKLTAIARDVPSFAIQDRIVLGNFSFQKMAMVRDLEECQLEIAAHDLIAALAGDPEAQRAVAEARCEIDPKSLDATSPQSEFLILDADSSQQRVIAATLGGQDGVIQGPPGTGKSQTIANLIASLVAAGKKVLFVAEKRAALEVVSRRLNTAGLGHIYLDLHGADIRRREVAARLGKCLSAVRDSIPVASDEVDRQFIDRRSRLNGHVLEMHTSRPPSKKSVYQMQGELLRLPPASRSTTRWRGEALTRLTPEVGIRARDLLMEAGGMSGLFLRDDPSPWTGGLIENTQRLQEALAIAQRLAGELWPRFTSTTADVWREVGVQEPIGMADATELLKLLGRVQRLLEVCTHEVFSLDLEGILEQLAPIGVGRRGAAWAWLTRRPFRESLRRTRAALRDRRTSWTELFRITREAKELLGLWMSNASTAPRPFVPARFGDAMAAFRDLTEALSQLDTLAPRVSSTKASLQELGEFLQRLAGDRETPYRLPNLYRIERELEASGLGTLVAELKREKPPPTVWPAYFAFAWLSSCLEAVRADEPRLAAFNGQLHDGYVREFHDLDQEQLELAAGRVRRIHAERAVAEMNVHPDQETVVRREAGKKARHLPIRQLLAGAPDVVLSLCPCWMASPLSVSHLLDGSRRYFDVVLFDEASQVLPEDAIPSMLRGSKLVVAGDRHQLPPTTFFEAGEDEESESDVMPPTEGFESILDLMTGFLQPWTLDWHYRSRDERLIAFSNRQIYDDRLITFPGVGGDPVISHLPVLSGPESETDPESSSREVQRVVDLVFAHAAERPEESLGVITMGLKHALRVEKAIWDARQDRPDLENFFDESREERFFVKNLERVQGDERDAVIISVGYGKGAEGRLLNRFGPLNYEGGERRLNVAITRARQRLAIVTSFDHTDMDPTRFTARGVKLLKDYLEYASSGGETLRISGATGEALNPFESDVFETLTERGVRLIPQWGTSRYRIDMVAQDPLRPGRFVMAIECDGASYHSAYTARERDRLRQQQLEALGWRFHRIWSTDWFLRKSEEVQRALEAYKRAVSAAEGGAEEVKESADVAPGIVKARTSGQSRARPSEGSNATGRRGSRPALLKRASIVDYRQSEIMALVRWITSDGRVLTDEEILGETVGELGFSRRGARIEAAVRAAIEAARGARR